jgi:acyl CoA:acetate/3-ketoacid CoA transferase alpha subunit
MTNKVLVFLGYGANGHDVVPYTFHYPSSVSSTLETQTVEAIQDLEGTFMTFVDQGVMDEMIVCGSVGLEIERFRSLCTKYGVGFTVVKANKTFHGRTTMEIARMMLL